MLIHCCILFKTRNKFVQSQQALLLVNDSNEDYDLLIPDIWNLHIDQSTCMFNLKLGIYTLVSPFQLSPNSCLYQQDQHNWSCHFTSLTTFYWRKGKQLILKPFVLSILPPLQQCSLSSKRSLNCSFVNHV